MLLIERLDHRAPSRAGQIHALMALAHRQEAEILQLRHAGALATSRTDIEASASCHLGAFRQDELVGVTVFGPDDEAGQFLVSALVVHPLHQRQGVARALMGEVLLLAGGYTVAVAAGEKNLPALALYRELGFVAYRFGSIGPEAMPLVKLRRLRRV
jgi:GNAT superfamily N-acetyltransferase